MADSIFMSLPKLDKKMWADSAQRRHYIAEVVRLSEAALDDAARAALYAQLAYFVELHNEGKVNELAGAPATIAKWRSACSTLHRAFYGFAPGEQVAFDVLHRAFETWPRDQFVTLHSLANELGDINDGASPGQLAKTLRRVAKERKLKLDMAGSIRLAAAVMFYPIPPPPS
jgi:hypothetical protein